MPVKKRKTKKISTRKKRKSTTTSKARKPVRKTSTKRAVSTRKKSTRVKRKKKPSYDVTSHVTGMKKTRKRKTKRPSTERLVWSRSIYPYPELNKDIADINKYLKKKDRKALVAIRPSHFTDMKMVLVTAPNERVMKEVLKWLQELDIVENAGSELRRLRKQAVAK